MLGALVRDISANDYLYRLVMGQVRKAKTDFLKTKTAVALKSFQ